MTIEEFTKGVSREDFIEFYNENTFEETKKHFCLSDFLMRKIVKLYNAKKEGRVRVKKEVKENPLTKQVGKEELEEAYIKNNKTQKQTCELFNIKPKQLNTLLKLYGIKKESSLHIVNIRKSKLEKYGDENFNNREKATSTCVEKYGVDNVGKVLEFQERAYIKKCENNGFSNSNNWKKNHETRVKNSGSIEKSYQEGQEKYKETCKQRYGVSNTALLIQTRVKIGNTLKETFQEKWGCDNYWGMENAKRSHGSINSAPNNRFKELLDENNIPYTTEFLLGGKWFDFKVGDTLIEINPTPTHNSTWSPFGKPLSKSYHKDKSVIAQSSGHRCIHVFDWDDAQKIISLLKPRNFIYARKCEIREVDLKIASSFIKENHIQGYARDSIRVGLFYNDELVSIMTFDKPRYNKNFEYEIIRYCSSKNVVGGAKKLFNFFVNTYKPKSLISYNDFSKFSGAVYEELGFIKKETSIGKHWFNIKTKQHITDNLLRLRGFDQLFGTSHGKGTSNEMLMLESGFVEVYDSGQVTYTISFV